MKNPRNPSALRRAPPRELRRLQRNLDDENDGVALYRLMAELEAEPERRHIFERLANVEARHASIWRGKLREAGAIPQERGPSLKTRLTGLVARRLGVGATLPIIRALEAGAYAGYMAQDETARQIAPDEMGHRVAITRLERMRRSAGQPTRRESWHRTGDGLLRASVFGINDGLVSNSSLIMGFAGAQVYPQLVVLAGVAGLLAGAFSMAVGEYVSVRAQRELYERQIDIEKRELESAPEEELEELAAIYEARGLPAAAAHSLAQQLTRDPAVALDVLVREELGLDPDQLGSASGAALSSFIAFSIGALLPLLPFFFARTTDLMIVAASGAVTALALFVVGASLSLFTGRNPMWTGLRQLGLGAAAAALTFAVGSLIGVGLSS